MHAWLFPCFVNDMCSADMLIGPTVSLSWLGEPPQRPCPPALLDTQYSFRQVHRLFFLPFVESPLLTSLASSLVDVAVTVPWEANHVPSSILTFVQWFPITRALFYVHMVVVYGRCCRHCASTSESRAAIIPHMHSILFTVSSLACQSRIRLFL